ncbi:hypothetical protein EBZ37_08380, partial [bacterium]|nr:hypothetical protein [bacterium]
MRILGIDWGTNSIKAVEIDSAFGRYEIHDYREIEIPSGTDPSAAASQLLASLSQAPGRIVVSMRSDQVTTRNLHLPTRDRKAIQSGILFELEDDLPFPIEDMAHDSSVLSQIGQQSDVHVATTLKKHLVAEIQRWKDVGLDPDAVTTEGWALRTLLNKALSPEVREKPVLLVDIGAKSTLLYLHWRSFPMVCRKIRWGGDNITQELVQRIGLSEEQAERVKRNPAVLSETHPQSLLDLVSSGLEDIQREIKHMDLVCKAMAHENLQRIYVTGGGSLIEGLPEELESRIGIPVERIRPLSSLSPSGVTFAETSDARMGLAAALAMTMVGAERNLAINLRRGELAKTTKSREINLENLKKPLAAAALVATSFFLSMAVQSSLLQKRLESKDEQLRRSMTGFFGSVSSSAMRTYLANPSSLKTAIQKELEKTREMAAVLGQNPASPLILLKNLSKNINKGVTVDMMNFTVGSAPTATTQETPVEITVISTDPSSAQKISEAISPKLIQSDKPT